MKSLRELIERGQYELAAHRLVVGAVQTQLEQRRTDVSRVERGAMRGTQGVNRGRP